MKLPQIVLIASLGVLLATAVYKMGQSQNDSPERLDPSPSNVIPDRKSGGSEANALERFRQVEKTSGWNDDQKHEAYLKLIPYLVAQHGHLEVFNMLLNQIGRGSQLNALTSEIFANSGSISEGLSIASEFEESFHQQAAIGLFEYLTRKNFPEAEFAEFFDSPFLKSSRNMGAVAVACDLFILNVGNAEGNGRMIDLAFSKLSGEKATIFLGPMARHHGLDVLSKMESIGDQKLRDDLAKLRQLSMDSALSQDPNGLMSFLASNSNNPSDFLSTFQKWYGKSEKDAGAWLDSNMKFLGDDQKSGIFGAIAFQKAMQGEFEESTKLRAEITSQDVRNTIDGWIYNHQKSVVQSRMEKDPVVTIRSLVDDKSNFPHSLIESAMNQWIEKDAEAAAKWVQEEFSNLPRGATQYVAIPYVREAIRQGDLSTARQWADLVVDKDQKARVDSMIAKAESIGSR